MSEAVLVKVATPKGGSGFPEVLQGNTDGDISFIKVSDMSLPGNEKYITRANNFVSRILAKEMSFTVFPKDTIVFAKVGGALLLNRRRILAGDTIIDNNMMGLIPTECDPEFLFHFMCRVDLARFVYPGVLPSVNQSTVGAIEFPGFKKATQRRIATILTTMDEVIEATEKLVEKHQQIKAGLMHDLFTRGLWTREELARGDHEGLPSEASAKEGQLRPTPEEAPGLYQDSPLGLIPKEWKVCSLDSVSEFVTSGSRGWAQFYSIEGSIFVRIGNLTREHINLRFEDLVRVKPPKSSEGNRTAVQSGDLLISITADLGIIAIIPDDFEEAFVNQHIALVRLSKTKVNPRFIGWFLGSNRGKSQFDHLGDSGAKAGLNLPTIRNLQVPQAATTEEAAIAKIIDTILLKITALQNHLAKLRQQKQGLMHDLLTGRVRVEDSDSNG